MKLKYKCTTLLLTAVLAACGGGSASDQSEEAPKAKKVLVYDDKSLGKQEVLIDNIEVTDGDTLKLQMKNGTVEKIRLAFIDAPESKQPYGKESKALLASCVDVDSVEVSAHKKDRYGRYIALVNTPDVSCNTAMLANGAAWVYTEYLREADEQKKLELKNNETLAVTSKKGMWALPCAIAPWDWRKGKRDKSACSLPISVKSDPKILPQICKPIPKTCGAMASCTQAYTALNTCKIKTLDRNNDGVPCEALCK